MSNKVCEQCGKPYLFEHLWKKMDNEVFRGVKVQHEKYDNSRYCCRDCWIKAFKTRLNKLTK